MALRGTPLPCIVLALCVTAIGCDCPVDVATRSFRIDASEAARILDADGRPIPSVCASICDQRQRIGDSRFDTAVPDGAPIDAGVVFEDLPPYSEDHAFACEVVSEDTSLEVRCHWHYTFLCWG